MIYYIMIDYIMILYSTYLKGKNMKKNFFFFLKSKNWTNNHTNTIIYNCAISIWK